MPWSSIRPHPLLGAARSCVRLQPVRSVSCCLQVWLENFVKNKAKQSRREDVGTWLGASSAVVLSPSACVPSGVTPRSATTIGSAVAGTRRTLVASRWERSVQHARTHAHQRTDGYAWSPPVEGACAQGDLLEASWWTHTPHFLYGEYQHSM